MATSKEQSSFVVKLQQYCASNAIEPPQFQDYSDPRGIRTAWSSAVWVQGRKFEASLWRDYRFLNQSREDAAELAYRTLVGDPPTTAQATSQYSHSRGGYGSSR
ncbi:hypothetical protein K505DRAFT_24565 [Melanomma pulvis-pyrius CBS 109.77]|uniref:DRBM domain-containing protein n=1 Tax=Melanomma pulvis-pyrius CBS 109.77 TaxID=1314802 RepID=A0A6A6XEZ6_9PLEO|nr:hypothetical protein K505DRAFT_24565 [Melanomma pulvis-pyrius CBS 109.77]